MPEYETSGEKAARRSQRPVIEHAAEVTKKAENVKKEDLEQPPAFRGRKIAGAKNFLARPPEVSDQVAGSADQHTSLADLPGTGASSQTSLSTPTNPADVEDVHVLATRAGTRRFWGYVFADIVAHPDVRISRVCKVGYDEAEADRCEPQTRSAFRDGDVCSSCRVHGTGPHLITYRPPERLGEYVFRTLEKMYRAAQARGLAFPTTTSSHFCRDVDAKMIELSLPTRVAESSKSSSSGSTSLHSDATTASTSSTSNRHLTHSHARDRYHELKEWAKREPSPMRGLPDQPQTTYYWNSAAVDPRASYSNPVDMRTVRQITVETDTWGDSNIVCKRCHDYVDPESECTRSADGRHSRQTKFESMFDESEANLNSYLKGRDEARQREHELAEARKASQSRMRLLRVEQARRTPRIRRQLQREMMILCSYEVRSIVRAAMPRSDRPGRDRT